MPVIVPVRDLKDTNRISELCNREMRPVFVTKNGYGDMVIMSMAYYEEALGRNAVYAKLEEARSDIAAGRVKPLRQAINPTFHVRNESPRFARAFVRFLELSNKGLHYTPADAVCAASELTFGGGCAGSVSPSWFKRILTSSFGST